MRPGAFGTVWPSAKDPARMLSAAPALRWNSVVFHMGVAESMRAGSTQRCSQAVSHPSTNRALCRLTSEVGRDPVHSARHGRQRTILLG